MSCAQHYGYSRRTCNPLITIIHVYFKEFNVGSYSTVSTIIDRIKDEIAKDRKVNRLVEQLKDDINMSQIKT
jgi:hypothetical protein